MADEDWQDTENLLLHELVLEGVEKPDRVGLKDGMCRAGRGERRTK
jgi:hypothetical protein